MALDSKTHNLFVDTADFGPPSKLDPRSAPPTADSNSWHIPRVGLWAVMGWVRLVALMVPLDFQLIPSSAPSQPELELPVPGMGQREVRREMPAKSYAQIWIRITI
jgi:hypothetical protein